MKTSGSAEFDRAVIDAVATRAHARAPDRKTELVELQRSRCASGARAEKFLAFAAGTSIFLTSRKCERALSSVGRAPQWH